MGLEVCKGGCSSISTWPEGNVLTVFWRGAHATAVSACWMLNVKPSFALPEFNSFQLEKENT